MYDINPLPIRKISRGSFNSPQLDRTCTDKKRKNYKLLVIRFVTQETESVQ